MARKAKARKCTAEHNIPPDDQELREIISWK
jgi:hypothetical protein